jgi:hypothetical protein
MNEYSDDDGYDMHASGGGELGDDDGPLFLSSQEAFTASVNFDDPDISSLPRVLLMGPRRGGKTSIQVSREQATTQLEGTVLSLLLSDAPSHFCCFLSLSLNAH